MHAHSKSQLAYDLLRERIAAGEFQPGHRLVLAQLATMLDMSVVPIREAIRRLEAEGVVEFERNVGARVASIDRTQYLHTMEALAILEASATALAAPIISGEDIAQARTLNRQIAEGLASFDPDVFARLNAQFHRVLYAQCPNPYLCELVDAAWAKVSMVREPAQTFLPERARQSVHEHEELLRLIERGVDSFEIERAVRAHRTATREAALAHLSR